MSNIVEAATGLFLRLHPRTRKKNDMSNIMEAVTGKYIQGQWWHPVYLIRVGGMYIEDEFYSSLQHEAYAIYEEHASWHGAWLYRMPEPNGEWELIKTNKPSNNKSDHQLDHQSTTSGDPSSNDV